MADGKPTEAIDQALLLLASVPPERPPQGTAAAAAGSGTPAGADAGAALPCGTGGATVGPGVVAANEVAEQASASLEAAAAAGPLSVGEPAMERGAKAEAAGGGKGPQGADCDPAGQESGSGAEKGLGGSSGSGSGHGGGRVEEEEEEEAAANYDQGMLDELGDALATPAAVSAGQAGAAKSQAAGPLPEQQGQLVAVVQEDVVGAAAPAPAAGPETRKRGKSGGELIPKPPAKQRKT